ncbi:MAG: helix-turn-helix transcriptional regulator [Verrucomicrobia bacterium]|nr:PadR family transcriptional regulator [Kiritimatiellia bacterium]MCO6400411.1 helix-turn-helix transcriptional regulator [Verrucomicrobiota bacterium]
MNDSWTTQWRKGLLEYCLLLVLSRGESYGYEIVQALQQVEALAVSESTVYPILTRLRASKLLKVRDVPSDAGPPRRYYALTALGRIRLAEMQAYWKLLSESVEQLKEKKAN